MPGGSLPASSRPRCSEKVGRAMTTTVARASERRQLGAALDHPGPAVPEPGHHLVEGAVGLQLARWRRLSTLMPDEAEQRRQQRQRRRHGEDHGQRSGHGDAVEERQAEGELAEQGDAHGDPGEEHGPPGRIDGLHGGLLDAVPGLDGVAVTGDDEQGVVDADPEADQDAQDGGEAGDGEHVAEQPGERVADTDGDQGGDERQESGEQGTEGEAEHDQRQHDPRSGARRAALCLGVLDVLAAEGHLQLGVRGRLRGVR